VRPHILRDSGCDYLIPVYYVFYVIQSFGNQTAVDLFRERNTRDARRLPRTLWAAAKRKLKALDVAHVLSDLRIPSGNRLELLRGDRSGSYSIRINDQFRITFRWEAGHAHEVCVEDYH
jgi:toxin HigB-1